MSEENKIVELNAEDLEKVNGGLKMEDGDKDCKNFNGFLCNSNMHCCNLGKSIFQGAQYDYCKHCGQATVE